MRLIDADKLKQHYQHWQGTGMEEYKDIFDTIIDLQPTVEKEEEDK